MSLKGRVPLKQRASDLNVIRRDIRAMGTTAGHSVQGMATEDEPSEVESGVVRRTLRDSGEMARNTAKFASHMIRKNRIQARNRIVNEHKQYVTERGIAGLSYGDPDAKQEFRSARTSNMRMHRTGRSEPGKERLQKKRAAANVRKGAAKSTGRSAAAGAAKQGVNTAGAAAKKGIASIGKGFAGGFKWLLPFSLPMVAIVLVVIILMGALFSVISPLGFFFSDNKADNTYSAGNIIARVNQNWYDELASERKKYEDMGYTVNVSYNVGAGDGVDRISNWEDVLALYIVRNTDKDKSMVALNASDEAGIKRLFFDMNPINISTRVEQVEKDGQKEDVHYADISVTNLRYVQMLSKYPLDSFQSDMIKLLMQPDMASTWADMGIDFGDGAAANVDVNLIIRDLPTGSLGSKIVQAAFTRLGDPYSMDLRGQGDYVDCSYFTQWAYAQAGISIPGTAAEQAQYCVQAGKVIYGNTLQPGDLIFWSYPNNPRVAGRFMEIGHVAIYVGNGMMIEAAPSAGGVTYRAVSVQGGPVLYAKY